MKKIMSLIIILALSLSSLSFAASENVTVTIPEFDVTVNGVTIDIEHSQYPVVTYKNITYIPMTSDYLSGFGLISSFSGQNGLSIDLAESVEPLNQNFVGANNRLGSDHTAELVPFDVTVNGQSINNANEEFPILLYKNITYFPMTWRFAVTEFAWKTGWSDASGFSITVDKEDFFEIRKIEDLFEINESPEETFRLVNDLDFSDINDYHDKDVYYDYIKNKELPVDLVLKSKLDGNGKTISNLVIHKSNQDKVAFFKKIDNNAILQNLKIVNFDMIGKNDIALLTIDNFGSIRNVEINGDITGERIVAGVAVNNFYTIKDSKVDINFTGTNTYDVTSSIIGGFAGRNRGVIERVVANGTINGTHSIGGIAGTNLDVIRNAVSNVNVTSSLESGDHTGGAVGINDGGRVENVIAYGEVVGRSYTGGVVGSNQGGLVLNSVAANKSISGTRNVSAVIGLNSYTDADDYGTYNNYYFSNIPLSAIQKNTKSDTMGVSVGSYEFITRSQGMAFWNVSIGNFWDYQSVWEIIDNQVQLRE